jgi:hypothetical protein
MDIGIIFLLISSFHLLTSPFAKGIFHQLIDTRRLLPAILLVLIIGSSAEALDRIRIAVSNPHAEFDRGRGSKKGLLQG